MPDLDKIQAPLLAINFGDDLLNPPELGSLPAAMKRVAHGISVVIPAAASAHRHQSLAHPGVWVKTFAYFMRTLPGASH